MNSYSVLIIAATLLAIPRHASSITEGKFRSSELERQKHELFKWMDEVAFPSATESEFFEITLPMPENCGNRLMVLRGFLISKSPGKRVYFTDDASEFTLHGNPSTNTTIRKIEFNKYVDQVLTAPNPYLESSVNAYCIEMGPRCSHGRHSINLFPAMRDILLARWCFQRGNNDAADRLWSRAEATMPKLDLEPVGKLFRNHVPAILLDRVVASMADPATRREDCMAKLDWIGTTWDGCEYGELAKKLRDDLKVSLKMQRELDNELNRSSGSPPTSDQLVRQLLDQEFWCGDIGTAFGPFAGTGGVSPFSEIVRQPDLARGVLSMYLDSEAPTRLVCRHPKELPSMRWETLGTVARLLLEQIDSKAK